MLFCSGLHPIQQAKHWLLLANLLLWSVKGQKFRVRRFAKTWLSNVQWDKSEEVKKMTSTFRLYTKTEWRRCQSRILLSVIFVILFWVRKGDTFKILLYSIITLWQNPKFCSKIQFKWIFLRRWIWIFAPKMELLRGGYNMNFSA